MTANQMDKVIKEIAGKCHSISIDITESVASVRVWEKSQGNRKPIADASRPLLSDALEDIVKKLK